jgi:predicted Zn-dependent protease
MALKNRSLITFIITLITITLVTEYQVYAESYKEPRSGELRRVPDTQPLEYLSALDLRQVGDTDEAYRRLRQSLKQYPYHELTLRGYLELVLRWEGLKLSQSVIKDHYRRTGSSKLFRSFFKEVRRDTPNDREILRWLDQRNQDLYLRRLRVRHLVGEQRYDRAEKLLRDGLKRFSEDRRLALLYAEVLAYRSKCAEAYRRVRKIVTRNPGWARPYILQDHLIDQTDTEYARKIEARYRGLTGSDFPPDDRFSSIQCTLNPEEISGESS